MSRRSHVVRTRQPAVARALPLSPDSVAGDPAYGTLRGNFIMESETVGALVATDWWQTPRLDPYVAVENGMFDTPVFRVIQECALMVFLEIDLELPADDDEPGHFYADIEIRQKNDTSIGIVNYFSGSRGHGDGPFKRSAYVSDDSVYYAGINVFAHAHLRFLPDSGDPEPWYEIFPWFRNKLENTTLYGEFTMTVIKLDIDTYRSLGGT